MRGVSASLTRNDLRSFVFCKTKASKKTATMTVWIHVNGILAQGYRVASGPSADYPYGSLERQRPIFKSRGLDLDRYFNGTLNIDIRPYAFRLEHPEYTFRQVEWTDLHPPEHFSFSRCKVI